MKILFVINQLHCGGAEQQLIALCKGLSRRRHKVAVISIYEQLDLREELDALNVPITVAHKRSKLDLTIIFRLRELIEKCKSDVVHAYLPASCLFTGMAKWCGVRAPLLHAERSVNYWKPKWRVALDNAVRRKVVMITCNADSVRQHLIRIEGVAPEKTALVYNGVTSDRRKRPSRHALDMAKEIIGAPQGSFVIICVANFIPVKQHDVLLRAVAQAKTRVDNLFLLLIGRGPLAQKIQQSIESLGLGDSSRIISNCTNPLPFLSASNLAILTSAREGCSNAILEAMGAGLPVVASDAGGNRELVTDGLGGVVCPVGDTDSFGKVVARLAEDGSLCEAMGLYNSRRVAQEFTEDIMTERTLSLYEQVLGKVNA